MIFSLDNIAPPPNTAAPAPHLEELVGHDPRHAPRTLLVKAPKPDLRVLLQQP